MRVPVGRPVIAPGIEEALTAEEEGNRACVASRDASEGFAAFIEKRTPVFTGE